MGVYNTVQVLNREKPTERLCRSYWIQLVRSQMGWKEKCGKLQ